MEQRHKAQANGRFSRIDIRGLIRPAPNVLRKRPLVKRFVKDFLKAVAPKQFAAMMATRENRHGQRVMEKQGVPAIAHDFVERHGLNVQGGPFAGMTYIAQSAGSSFLPKLIGSYECERLCCINRF